MAGDAEADGQRLKEVTQREKYDGKPSDERKKTRFYTPIVIKYQPDCEGGIVESEEEEEL